MKKSKRRKRNHRLMKDVLGLTTEGVTMGIGASVVEATPGTSTGAARTIPRMAAFMPAMGTTIGAGHTMTMLSDLNKSIKKRR